MAKVTVYSSDYCGYCRAAKRLLDSKGIPYEEINLEGDDEGRDALRVRTGRTSVPQIFIGEVHVGGFDDLRALDQKGGLEPLLRA
ncbi:MAG: glutaredoxin 3 [Pseudomonadota bacterium]|nr:glutaredoxin 3 [Pseudomonadota bacterium]